MDISIEVPKEVIIKAKLDRLMDGFKQFFFMAQNENLKGLAIIEVFRIRKIIKELNEICPEAIKELFGDALRNTPEETKRTFISLFGIPI